MNWQQACELPYYGGSDLGANPAAFFRRLGIQKLLLFFLIIDRQQ